MQRKLRQLHDLSSLQGGLVCKNTNTGNIRGFYGIRIGFLFVHQGIQELMH